MRKAYVEEAGPNQPPELTAGMSSAVLNKGTYVTGCRTPTTMAVQVCAAIRDGHAIGVTVKTTPSNEAIARCIAEAVQGLHFRVDHRLDVTFTTFAAD